MSGAPINVGLRAQVMMRIIDVMQNAQDEGRDGLAAAQAAFPGTPLMVLAEAWANLDLLATEEWWQGVERTIDGEIIERALTNQGART